MIRLSRIWNVFVLILLGSITTSQAQIAVSDSGTPAFSQPIAVPPGVAGMEPKLGLYYSGSSGVNGPVGYGWSLQGLSTITRCPATVATDGHRAGVNYTRNDKLCLDGQRLILTDSSGTPCTASNANCAAGQVNDANGLGGGAFQEYRTEKDTYVRIRSYGAANYNASLPDASVNGPAYFKVWTKSGQLYEYGASPSVDGNANALVSVQGSLVAAAWAVARISDTVGNYIDFKYQQRSNYVWGSNASTGHEWDIAEIDYTGRAGQAPANKVIFTYSDNRPDGAEAYHQGAKNVSGWLLQSISTYINAPYTGTLGVPANAVKVKTYTPTYSTGTISKRSRVTALTECVGTSGTACLPPTQFQYGAGGSDNYVAASAFNLGSTTLLSSALDTGVLTGDFNGDGKTDIIIWSDTPANNQLWLSNGDGTFTKSTSFNITSDNLFKSNGCYQSIVADFNGDGVADILRYSLNTDQTGAACTNYGTNYLYLGNVNGTGTFTQNLLSASIVLVKGISQQTVNCLQPVSSSSLLSACPEPGDKLGWTGGSNFYLLDYNGDGIIDIVTTILPAQTPVQTGNPPASSNKCLTLICTHVYKGNSDGTFTEVSTNVLHNSLYAPPFYLTGSDNPLGSPTNTVDFDSDGFTDIVGVSNTYFETATGWRSRGDGNFDAISGSSPCGYPIDFNGDNKIDCLVAGLAPAQNSLSVANGTGSFTGVSNFNLTNAGQDLFGSSTTNNKTSQTIGIVITDVNGDGRHDILRWEDTAANNALYLSNGDGTFTASPTFNLGTSAVQLQKSDGKYSFLAGDFTGHGNVEILRLSNTGTSAAPVNANVLYIKQDQTPPDQLQRVTSSTGLVTDLTYRTLTNPGTGSDIRYQKVAATYPKVAIAPPIQLVVTATTDSGVGTNRNATDYSYAGLQADYQGRGSLGFSQVIQRRPAADGTPMSIATQYLQIYPYIGLAYQTSSYLNTANVNDLSPAPLSTTTNYYCDQTSQYTASSATLTGPCTTTSLVQRPYLYKAVENGNDIDSSHTILPTVTTTNTFNGVGDPLNINVTTTLTDTAGPLSGTAQSFGKTTVNTYYADNTAGDNWILGRLQKSLVQSVIPTPPNITPAAGTASGATSTSGTSTPLAISINPSPASVTQATPGTLSTSATATVASASNATLPLTYSWSPSGSTTITASPASGTSNTMSASTTFSASVGLNSTVSATYNVTVSDAAGRSGTASVPVSMSVTTTPLNAPVFSPAAPSASRNNPGSISTTSTLSFSGGLAPYNITWTRVSGSVIGVPGNVTGTSSTSSVATFSATLGWGANVSEQFTATVTDSIGQSKSTNITVTLTSPAAPTVSISPSSLGMTSNTSGGTASGSATATGSGGVAPYSYSWSLVSGTGINLTGATSATAGFNTVVTYNSSNTNTFKVTLTDAAANTATATISVTATGPIAPPSVTLSPANYYSTVTRATGTAVSNFAAVVSGGVAPFTYAWTTDIATIVNPTSSTATYSLSNSVACSDKTAIVKVTVTDSLGHNGTASGFIGINTQNGSTPCP